MSNKNIYVFIAVLIILIAGAFGIYKYKKHEAVSPKTTDITQTGNSSTDTQNNQPKELTSSADIGTLTLAQNGNDQLYQNDNLGIQLAVPKNWTLDHIYSKDDIIFRDPANPDVYALEIKYYKDFQTWYNSPDKTGPANCTSIKQCFEQDGDYQVSTTTVNSYPALNILSIAGEAYAGRTIVEHNGIYEFSNQTNAESSKNPTYNLNTLKFLNK